MLPVARTKFFAVAAALIMVGWLPGGLSPASGEQPRPALGETRVFTRVPSPGSGGGLVVDGDTVWAATIGFMDPDVDHWPVWAYDRRTGREKVDQTFTVNRAGPAVMALRGVARDVQGRLYLVDMNGRVLRATLTSTGRRAVEVYATIPTFGNGAAPIPWAGVSMPVDITFDAHGNAYIADFNFPAIWRVPPGGGEAELWFVDPRLQGVGNLGVAAARLAPNGRDLYFSMCVSSSPHRPLEGVIYRIPIDTPAASAVTEVFRSPGSCPGGLVFGASGKLYASLFTANQVLILTTDGTEERRFPSKQANAAQEIPYDLPSLLAFDGDGWLLVGNEAPTTPEHSAILKAFVDDTAAPLAEPLLP